MKALFVITALIVGIAAQAKTGTEVGYTLRPVHSKATFIASDVRNFAISSASVGVEAAAVQTTVDQGCLDRNANSDDSAAAVEILCENTKTVSKRSVVKVRVSYINALPSDMADASDYVDLSIPAEQFTADQLAAIQAHAAKTVLKLNVQSFTSTETLVDNEKTQRCDLEDETQCPAPVYGQFPVQKVQVSVVAK